MEQAPARKVFPKIFYTVFFKAFSKAFLIISQFAACLLGMCPGPFFQKATAQPKLSFQHYSIQEGLANTHVLSVFQDAQGLLWIGTYSGLHQFNGYDLTLFEADPEDSMALSNNAVNLIYEDREGQLWLGTEGGLNCYNRQTGLFRRFMHDPYDTLSLSHNTVKTIYEDAAGTLWVGTYGGGLNKLLPNGKGFQRYHSGNLGIANEEFDRINTLYDTGEGTFWIGTEKGGIFIFSPKAGRVLTQYAHLQGQGSEKALVTTLLPHSSGVLYVGTWNDGLFRFEPETESFARVPYIGPTENNPSRQNIRMMLEDGQGHLWLAHFGAGLTRLTPASGAATHFAYRKNQATSLSNDYAWALGLDQTDNLWVGTFGGGLNRAALGQYTIPLKALPGMPNDGGNNVVKAILEDHCQHIWLGTFSRGLYQYHLGTGTFTPFPLPVQGTSNSIITLFEDSRHNLWVGTDFGLFCIDAARKSVKAYTHQPQQPASMVDAPVFSFAEGVDGTLYVGTWNGGLLALPLAEMAKANPAQARFVHYRHNPADSTSLSSNIINGLHADASGQLWLATASHLETLNPATGQFTRLKALVAGAITQDGQGHVWVASNSEGLYQYQQNGELLRHFGHQEQGPEEGAGGQLPSPVILSLAPDGQGRLWLGTNKGLSLLNTQTLGFTHLSLSEELRQNALTANALALLANGAGLVGGVDGFNVVWPDSLPSGPPAQPVRLAQVLINDSLLLPQDARFARAKAGKAGEVEEAGEVPMLVLHHQDKFLSLGFAALEYAAPQRIQYAYRMEGYSQAWHSVSPKVRQANYSGLPAGNYTFWVRATNPKGEWGPPTACLKLVVTPPFWATTWFQALAVLGLGLLVFGVVQLRTQTLQRQKRRLAALVKAKTAEVAAQNEQLGQQNEELITQKEAIEQFTDELKLANENKIRFFTSVSHEFRTPLTLILGPLGQLKERLASDAESRDYLAIMEKNGYRLLRLINDILDFRKIDTGHMQVVCVQGDMVGFLRDMVRAFEATAHKKQLTLHFESEPAEFTTWFDPGKLEIIGYNLLGNAMKHTPAGGQVHVRFAVDGPQLVLQVADNGVGIGEEARQEIFSRFYQVADEALTAKGSGIGLALTKEIIDQLGGSIGVESEPGQGSTFTVRLPLIDRQQARGHMVFKEGEQEGPQPMPDFNLAAEFLQETLGNAVEVTPAPHHHHDAPRILVIEDDPDMRTYVARCLAPRYQVATAPDGPSGLAMARQEAEMQQPHLIISDIQMPGMNGIEVCRQLKEDFATSHIPVVLLTAQTAYDTQLQSFGTGADAFISKPFQKAFLLTRVAGLLRSRERLHEKFKQQATLEPQPVTISSMDEAFVQQAKALVEANIDNTGFGVNDLIRELGVSRTLLHTKFKKLVNCSSGEFIKTIRMNRAAQLLAAGQHRISEVCYLVGYADPHNFGKIFKQHFGQAPSVYQKAHSEKAG